MRRRGQVGGTTAEVGSPKVKKKEKEQIMKIETAGGTTRNGTGLTFVEVLTELQHRREIETNARSHSGRYIIVQGTRPGTKELIVLSECTQT